MQKFKSKFKDPFYQGTCSNIQPCIRLNDLTEIGDGIHYLYFNMIGFFSFREMTVGNTINFWFEFLSELNIHPDYVTIHPDKLDEWSIFYLDKNVEIRTDVNCLWSDGDIGGYCTEFYKNDIEIGNIVNPLGDCIDVGFGLERLELILGINSHSREEILKLTVDKIIDSGFRPSNTGGGYVLRKLLRMCNINNIIIDHPYYEDELLRQEKNKKRYLKLKDKNLDKSKDWWWETHGIDLDLTN